MPSRIAEKLVSLYARAFSRGTPAKLNRIVLLLSLRAMGYNNYRNGHESGEDFFIDKILAPSAPSLCLDIGANVGAKSAAILARTSARVISFEPVPATFRQLERTLAPFADRARAENMGVSDSNGSLTIHFNAEASTHASFSQEINEIGYIENSQSAEVPTTTLDRYCQTHGIAEIDFIKVDVEGFEGEVLRGAKAVLTEIRPRFVQIELNWHQLFKTQTLYAFSKQFPGYKVFQLVPGGWVERDPQDRFSNIFSFANFIFVRPD